MHHQLTRSQQGGHYPALTMALPAFFYNFYQMDKYRTPKHIMEEHKRRQQKTNRPNMGKYSISRRLDIMLPDNKAFFNTENESERKTSNRQSFQYWMENFDGEAPLNFDDIKPNFYISSPRRSMSWQFIKIITCFKTSKWVNTEILTSYHTIKIFLSLHQLQGCISLYQINPNWLRIDLIVFQIFSILPCVWVISLVVSHN